MGSLKIGAKVFSTTLALLVLIAFTPSRALAQTVPLPPPAFAIPKGMKIADFHVNAGVLAAVEQTSNLDGDKSQRKGKERILTSNASAQSTWDKHSLLLSAGYHRELPWHDEAVSSTEVDAQIQGRADISKEFNLTAGLVLDDSIVTTDDPYQFSGSTGAVIRTKSSGFGANWTGQKLFAKAEYHYQDTKTQADVNGSTISNSDRDEHDWRAEFGSKFDWGMGYIFGGMTTIAYDNPTTPRDSRGFLAGVGGATHLGDIQLSGNVAMVRETFDSSTVDDFFLLVSDVTALYQANKDLSFGLTASREFSEQDLGPTAAGVVVHEVSFGVQYVFSDTVFAKAGPSYSYMDVKGLPNTIRSRAFDGTLAWQPNEHIQVPLTFHFSKQDATPAALSSLDFIVRSVTLGVQLSL